MQFSHHLITYFSSSKYSSVFLIVIFFYVFLLGWGPTVTATCNNNCNYMLVYFKFSLLIHDECHISVLLLLAVLCTYYLDKLCHNVWFWNSNFPVYMLKVNSLNDASNRQSCSTWPHSLSVCIILLNDKNVMRYPITGKLFVTWQIICLLFSHVHNNNIST